MINKLTRNVSSAQEVDEKVAGEIKVALDTGVLKNHRNNTFTRLARNTARTTHAYKKAHETRQQKKALNNVDKELASLKNFQKENAARIKELKATKSNIAGRKKSSKVESSSSSKVATMGVSKRKMAAKVASRVATIRAGTFLHSMNDLFRVFLNIHCSPMVLLGIDHKRTQATFPVVSEPIGPKDTNPSLDTPMDSVAAAAIDSTKSGNSRNTDIEFQVGYMRKLFSNFETVITLILN